MSEVRLDRCGAVATIAIDRPAARNSLTPAVGREFYAHVRAVAGDPDIRVLVVRGTGNDFCCGADLRAPGHAGGVDRDPAAAEGPIREIHDVAVLLHTMPAITIAAIRGGCAGAGLGWACACDVRVAAADAKFNTAFLEVGVAGDMALPWSLPRLVGAARARELSFLTGKFDAAAARNIGLVARVWDAGAFEAELGELVARLAGVAPLALAALKANYLEAERLPLADYVRVEADRHHVLLATDDCREAFAARAEKRAPRFRGR